MGLCETCVHWDRNYVSKDLRYAIGSTYGICQCPKLCEKAASDDSDDQLVYPYDEGGYFPVGPKFGCIHHKEKV
jgi:hypothetical protein